MQAAHESTTKRCKRCGIEKPLSNFHKRRKSADGRANRCKDCISEIAGRSRQINKRMPFCEGYKWCAACKLHKPFADFQKDKQGVYGLCSYCKTCVSQRQGYQTRRIKKAASCSGNKWCSVCGKEYSLIEFYPDKRASDGKVSRCRYCDQEAHKKYASSSPVNIAKRHRRQARIRNLPDNFIAADWERALAYWKGCCAVCGRPPGLWHTLAPDHWIPLASPDCPGTISANIVPLCHGQGGCNDSKAGKEARQWLITKLGKRKGLHQYRQIQTYFRSLLIDKTPK